MINRVALIIALAISAIAGYFSVIGLATIFAGAFWAVVIMTSSLEAGKVVTVAWLSRNWDTSPKLIKYFLTVAAVVLMFITSMGTFGYLSKAHLEQTVNTAQSAAKLEQLEYQIQSEERKIKNAQTSLDTLDRLANSADPKEAVFVRTRQKKERDLIRDEMDSAAAKVENLSLQALPIKQETQKLEAEVGPLKYIAELIYGDKATSHFDSAVRGVIILLVLVFDPLAIALLIAANHGLKPQTRFKFNKATGKIELN